MKKTIKRPRHEIRHAQDMGPTPERAARSDWSGKAPKRVLTTVQALLNAGDITQEAANAADRWYRDYVFGYHDYREFAPDHVADTTTRHDAVSWQVVRANACGRIVDVRQALGVCAHQRLRMMLVDELSFRQMGEALFPAVSKSTSSTKVSSQCSFLLEQLHSFYSSQRADKRRTEAPRHVGGQKVLAHIDGV
ncbi:hypothetical protein [Acetobacter sp. P1H12_c]|uniref:hypothetical protein n=1 Tax=Acetobacter sp. P1H12_c TaxID=2762621 RepID=UPI001C05D9F7|nr:hypothetical protein [Acetobacter sp. P1H12_c]